MALKLASMASTIFAMDAVTYMASAMADQKKFDIRLEAAMAKLCCTEASWKIVDGTIQIRGGRGYETGPSLRARGEKGYAVERMMRDARINTIIEGTSQIMRLFIAREAMDTHVGMIMPLMSPKTKMGDKPGLLLKALKFYACWYPRQFLPESQLPQGVEIPSALLPHMKYIGKTARRLARNLFHAMGLYQQKLEAKQQLMARLVNIGTDLFAMAATCSRAMQLAGKGAEKANSVELADLFCRQAKGRIEKQFRSLFHNSDAKAYRLAQDVLADKYAWLENDIIPPMA